MKQRLLRFFYLLTALSFSLLNVGCDKDVLSPIDKYHVSTEADGLTFDENGGSQTLKITTDAPWQVNSSSDWIDFAPKQSGEAVTDYAIVITVAKYEEPNKSRTATISIKVGDLATDAVVRKFITITQSGPEVGDRDPGIYSKQDLIDFGAAIASPEQDYTKWADKDGVVNLMNDIDFGGTPIPCMGVQSTGNETAAVAFAGTFNGNEHTIKGNLDGNGKAIVALFTRLAPTGIIKNLTVDVTATNNYDGTDVQRHLAAIVGFSITATTGYIENCISKGTLNMPGTITNPRAGGIVAYGRCDIRNCVNYADITAVATRVAGICGAGGGAVSITGCTNYGNMSVDALAAQVGGIIGQLNGQTVTGCINNGNITATANGATLVGGIAGDAKGGAASIGSLAGPCVNNGVITLNPCATAPTNASAAGGISGDCMDAMTISYSTNNGNVINNTDNALVATGGIVGNTTKVCTISFCINGAVEIIGTSNVGGILGRATVASKIENCTNSGDVKVLSGATVPASFFGGIVGQGGSALLTMCIYGGTVRGVAGSESNAIGTVAP